MNKKNSTARNVGKYALRVLAVLLVTVLILVGTLYTVLSMICGDTSPAAKRMFVTTVLESGQLKFLASICLSPEEIQALVNENKMSDLHDDVNTDLIHIDRGGDTSGDDKNTDPIEKIEISGRSFFATLLIVKDPSKVSLATIYPWRTEGVELKELVESSGAIGGINGGLYNSTNNSGGAPYGVVVSNGERQHNAPQEWPGLVLIGFTEDDILQIIDLEGMSSSDVEKLVREKKIRDAVTFQEESSDKNNHFVQLIINGEERQLTGQGSGLNPRTAIGQRADGAVLMLVTDGRGSSGHLGASASDLIGIMKEYGAVNAANLDGGSSSCMYYKGEYTMPSVTFYYQNSSWKLPFSFVIHE